MKTTKGSIGGLPGAALPLLVAAALLGAAAPAVAKCVRPGGAGGCFGSISAAVAAAPAGGTVDVYPGIYRESVLIPAAGTRIVGKGRTPGQVRIDGVGLGSVHGVIVGGANVLLRNLTVQNFNASGVWASGTGLLLERVDVVGVIGYGIRAVPGAGTRIRSCRVTGCGDFGIYVDGAGSSIERCRVAKSKGVYLDSEGGRVTSTAVTLAIPGGNGGIYAFGDRIAVRGCTVQGSASYGIIVEGPGASATALAPLVSGNRVSSTQGSGIAVTLRGAGAVVGNAVLDAALGSGDGGYKIACRADCGGARILRNSLSRTGYARVGYSISTPSAGDGLLVQYNRAFESGGMGIEVWGVNNAVRNNLARGCGGSIYHPGIGVIGDGNLIEGNVARENLGLGMGLTGTDIIVRGNRAEKNAKHGLEIGLGGANRALVTGNLAFGNHRRGIYLDSSSANATVQGNTARGNMECDFWDEGPGNAVGGGNRFGSTCP